MRQVAQPGAYPARPFARPEPTHPPARRPAGCGRVVDCYTILAAATGAGIHDYTEGVYAPAGATSYDDAQRRQHDYVLDQLGAGRGFFVAVVAAGVTRRSGASKSAPAARASLAPS